MAERTQVKHYHSSGMVWFIGWLFTIGFLKLGFWKGLLGLIVWPYFIGVRLADAGVLQTAAGG